MGGAKQEEMGAEVSLDTTSSIPGCMVMLHPGPTTVHSPTPLPPGMMLTSKLPDDASTLYMTLPSGTDPHAAPAGTESSGDEDMYKDPSPTESRASTKKRKKDEARHYYRCTFPGCDAKRHITYQSDGPCITNLGSHSHEPPAPTAAERKKQIQAAQLKEANRDLKPKKKRVKTMSSRA